MNTSHVTTLVALLRAIPPDGAARQIALQRLTDSYAESEARAALATAPTRRADAPTVRVLAAATQAWAGIATDVPADIVAEELRGAAGAPEFLAALSASIRGLRASAVARPETGACTVATALHLWRWTMVHVQTTLGADAVAAAELSLALAPLLAAQALVLEVAAESDSAPGYEFRADVCHTYAARAAAEAAALCAQVVFGYRRHLAWDVEGCAACYGGDELDELEGLIPGIASAARAHSDVIEADGSHAAKAGPCARFDGVETFTRIRGRLDGCLTGARLAKDRAAAALPKVLAGSPELG